jgi:hypothetical protein
MPLTDATIRSAKAAGKAVKLFDGGGLYLLVNPSGARWWRSKYRLSGREKLISFGTHPEISLKIARERRDQARRLVATAGDRGAKRLAERVARAETFEAIALGWLNLKAKRLDARTLKKKRARFEAFVFPICERRRSSKSKRPNCSPYCDGLRCVARMKPRTECAPSAALCSAMRSRQGVLSGTRQRICEAHSPRS